jgi:asparagine synthase (glutamine-hydrolysing)
LPKLAAVFGEPFADSSAIPTHYLSRETRKFVKVALSGDGGDELFGGYERYRAMQLARRLRSLPNFVATIARSWSGGHPKSKLTRAARFAASLGVEDAERYDSYVRIFDDAMIGELLREDPGRRGVPRCPGVREVYQSQLDRTGDPVTAALATDRIMYLPNDLLTKVDRASMLHGLEVRSPFMDHELVQFAAGLTSDQLLKGGPKRMLREAFAHALPDFVFKRKKMGFAVPIGEWFRGGLRALLRDHLFASDSFARHYFNMTVVERLVDEHEQSRVDHAQRLYALLMLELWWTSSQHGRDARATGEPS